MSPRLRRIAEIAKRVTKRLYVFDFDDTLVKTKCLIRVKHRSGEVETLTPEQFAVYNARPGDEFDFSDFAHLIEPQVIKWTTAMLKSVVAHGHDVCILTARHMAEPVHEFLDSIDLDSVPVVALADSNPVRKAIYIEQRISADDFDYVVFLDDSQKNIDSVDALKDEYPHVTIVTHRIKH